MISDEDKVASWSQGKVARRSGVPNQDPKYRFNSDSKDRFSQLCDFLVAVGDWIICLVVDKGVVVFDRRKGVVAEKMSLERDLGSSGTICHNGRYLFVDPYVIDLNTLKVAYDPWPEFNNSEYEVGYGSGFINDYYVVREINRHRHPGVWWVFDLRTWKGCIEDIGVTHPCDHFGDPSLIVCLSGQAVQIRNMIDFSVKSEKIVPGISSLASHPCGIIAGAGKGMKEKKSYLDLYELKEIGCLDLALQSENKVKFLYFEDWFSPVAAQNDLNDRLNATVLYGYNWKTHDFLWEVDIGVVERKCIAGDLIFLGVDKNNLVAVDKWSGEVVWRVEAGFRPTSIHFYQNDVYFIDLYGNLMCYEWSEEYISPHRPTNPDIAWIRPE